MIGATMFSGIGAPETAMPHWHWAWHAEIEKFPSAVLAARQPESVNLGNVAAADFVERAAAIARPDVLVFGSPCQSFSVAGKRLGMDDPRGNLALVSLGIARQLRPEWLVFENVPGLLSSADGRDFGLFLRTVEECGYLGAWRVLDAQFTGVPQRRRRVFFVGRLGDWRGPAAVLFERESLRGDSPPRRQAGESAAPTISARPTGGGGLGTDFDLDGGLIATSGLDAGNVARSLNGKAGHGRLDGQGETFVTVAPTLPAGGNRTGGNRPPGTSAETAAMLIPVAFDCKAGGDTSFSIGDVPGALRGAGHGGGHAAVAYQCHGSNVGELGTLRAGNGNETGGVPFAFDLRGREGGSQFEGPHDAANIRAGSGGSSRSYIASSAVRRLTPRECERLQGFPDDHTLVEYRGKPAADGPRYKACGNSMAVPVMRWILSRIEAVDGALKVAA